MSYPCLLFFIKEQNKNLIKYTIVNHLGKNIWVGIRRLYRDKKICLVSQKQRGAIALTGAYIKVVLLIDIDVFTECGKTIIISFYAKPKQL